MICKALVKSIDFHNPSLTQVGVEVVSFAELRQQSPQALLAPQRPSFYLLGIVHVGQLRHVVDFAMHELSPDTLFFIRPGQIQQWQISDAVQGHLVVFESSVLAPSASAAVFDNKHLLLEEWPTIIILSQPLGADIKSDVARLRTDVQRYDGSEIGVSIIRRSLLLILLRLARAAVAGDQTKTLSSEAKIFRLFMFELASKFHKRLSVQDYAKRIGYSESSLSRACLKMAGHTAKNAIDFRVALEAKRLLVHTEATVTQIAYQLGFNDPTNFVKFFRRIVGTTPSSFRDGKRD